MGVAAYTQAAVDVAVIAWVGCLQVDDAFLQEYQALGGLECRTGGICGHEGAVEQRHGGVFGELAVVGASLAAYEQARVVGRRRHHAEYLACSRFDGYYGSAFANHKRLGILLQLDIDAQVEVASAHSLYVAGSVFVAALNASAGIAYKYFGTLFAAQIFFVAFFHAEVTGIVAGGIIRVALYVGTVHLAYVAQYVGTGGEGVLAQYPFLYKEAGKAV